jgi:hypothetical protein
LALTGQVQEFIARNKAVPHDRIAGPFGFSLGFPADAWTGLFWGAPTRNVAGSTR